MWSEDGTRAAILVNGVRAPDLAMASGVWYRWRVLLSYLGSNLIYLSLTGCELQLIAKDGVYLPTAPRPIKRGVMAAGNRADWMVMCREPGTYLLEAQDEREGASSLHLPC
jgi:FtsP/CotA-like multicopper oxidase with cupredoxin domain